MKGMPDSAPSAVIYFDGTCNLCNGFVDFLIRRDKGRVLRYASRQGAAFAVLAARHPEIAAVDTMLAHVMDGDRLFLKSDATLTALGFLPAPWPLLRVLCVVPRFLRNAVYDWVARNRYRFFGKRDTCRLPTPQERELFLD
jgi:predicted DCC family thiol-disulfide oxidoreductase YuxK